MNLVSRTGTIITEDIIVETLRLYKESDALLSQEGKKEFSITKSLKPKLKFAFAAVMALIF